MDDGGWKAAAEGCEYVLHIASPLGDGRDDETLLKAACEGTLRVLKAAVAAGARKVVLTSSTAACTPASPLDRPIVESDWTDPEQPGLSTYRKSKVLAEQAAWSFMSDQKTALTTILPGAIFGPVLTPTQQGSVNIIRLLLAGKPALLPRIAFNITDVRDLAEVHIRAMTSSAADGERFITLGDPLWFREVANVLRERLGEAATKVPTRRMPDIAARVLALASPQMRALMPLLGRTQKFSREKAERVLNFAPRAAETTVSDCGQSLVS
jgi:nucleoside-diphosphate-sugar epimerase